MGVYVSRLRKTRCTKKWPFSYQAYLIADSREELVLFASKLGLNKKWLQVDKDGFSHFDVTPRIRKLAIDYGAVYLEPDNWRRMLYVLMKAQRVK